MEVLHYTYGPYGYENHGFLQISADFPNKTACFIGSFPTGATPFLQLNFHPWPGRAEKAARGKPTEAAKIFTAMANGLLIWQI